MSDAENPAWSFRKFLTHLGSNTVVVSSYLRSRYLIARISVPLMLAIYVAMKKRLRMTVAASLSPYDSTVCASTLNSVAVFPSSRSPATHRGEGSLGEKAKGRPKPPLMATHAVALSPRPSPCLTSPGPYRRLADVSVLLRFVTFCRVARTMS